jgi:hypothetical protein
MNEPGTELDRERIERLMGAILIPIRENYRSGPVSRDRCFEALNALAGSVALVIHGSDGPGGEAEEFFRKALEQQLESDEPRPKQNTSPGQ